MLTKKILCIGGAGQLGKVVVNSLLPYHITNVDFAQHSDAQANILLDPKISPESNNRKVIDQLKK